MCFIADFGKAVESQIVPLVFLAMDIQEVNRKGIIRSVIGCLWSTGFAVFFSEYDIDSGNEYLEETDDKDRTETIVSRTAIGEKASFIKEFGVTDYEYEHVISIPLRTIMCIDLPRIDYDKDKKIKKSDLDFVKEENRKSWERQKAKDAKKKAEEKLYLL